jgi:hypothetical protein
MAVTWITSADVAAALGFTPAAAGDQTFLDDCTAAANEWARRRRLAAGYLDDTDSIVPDPAVKLGTVNYAAARYRARGAPEGFASYEDFASAAGTGSGFSEIKQLLGIPRPQVA